MAITTTAITTTATLSARISTDDAQSHAAAVSGRMISCPPEGNNCYVTGWVIGNAPRDHRARR